MERFVHTDEDGKNFFSQANVSGINCNICTEDQRLRNRCGMGCSYRWRMLRVWLLSLVQYNFGTLVGEVWRLSSRTLISREVPYGLNSCITVQSNKSIGLSNNSRAHSWKDQSHCVEGPLFVTLDLSHPQFCYYILSSGEQFWWANVY